MGFSKGKKLNISVLCDNPDSWIIPFAQKLVFLLSKDGHKAVFLSDSSQVSGGDILVLLGCNKIVGQDILDLNEHNLVVHESDLPKGKGMSPLTWQILEGKNDIPITLFEAEVEMDSGVIYDQSILRYDGNELVDDLRKKQGDESIRLVMNFVKNFHHVAGQNQRGESTYYLKRTAKDSELDIDKTIREQFNLLRVVDNERYPATFSINGHKYILKIYEDK